MTRPFISEFLLPLVRGGKLHVGRPIGARELGDLLQRWAHNGSALVPAAAFASTEESAAIELGWRRAARARSLASDVETPPLDAISLRLGAGLHNLLCLVHPDLSARGKESARQSIVDATRPFLEIGPPATAKEAINRHTLLARVPDIVQTEHVLQLWFGRKRYLGRTPPSRFLDGWRQVEHDAVERVWLREVGVPAQARSLWISLHQANPLAEALEPVRLEPPLAWERLLTVLRFPALARLAAGRILEVGLPLAGNALASALFRFASTRPRGRSSGASPRDVGFAVRFLCHAFWLHHLFVATDDEASAGWDLPAIVGAATDVEPALARPPDLVASQPLSKRVFERASALRVEVRRRAPDRWSAALQLCHFALVARER